MDYEKMYKAVLKTATQWIKDGCTDKEKICLECVFPELRESEDERMRKRIINILGNNTDAHEEGWVVYADEIAYLKKQKEEEGYDAIPVESTLEYKLGFKAGKEFEKQKEPPFVKDVVLGYPGLYFYDGEGMHFRGSPATEEKQKECVADSSKTSADEDERIRKAIVKSIEEDSSVYEQEVSKEQMLAYLEKQKEQKPAEVKDPFSNANFVRGYEFGYADAKREQKPIQTSEEKEYIRTLKSLISDFIRDKQPEDVVFYQKIYDWLDGRHIEQKPNIELIQQSWYMEGYHDREFGKEPKWILKTGEGGPKHELNPRYGEPLSTKQKPVEWSEEEERLINTSISFLKDFADKGYENAVECIDWLKSLCPKPNTVPVENATKFGNLEYERGVKDGIQSEKKLSMEAQRGANGGV